MTLVWRRQCDRLLCVCVCVCGQLTAQYDHYDHSIRTLRTACILHIGAVAAGRLEMQFLSLSTLEWDESEWPASLPGRFTFGEMAPGTG